MAPDAEYVHAAFSAIAPRYVAVNHILSLGVDILWRSRAVELVADWKPSSLLDVATGTGDLALDIQRELPEIEVLGVDFCKPVLGVDFCKPMLEIARRRGLRHALCADAMRLPFKPARFDVLTTAFGLRNMQDYRGALHEFRRVLRSGGHLLVLDFSIPEGVISSATYRFYLHHILPRLAGLFTTSASAYFYLGESIERFPRRGAMCDLLVDVGYSDAVCIPLLGGIAAIYVAQA